MSQRKTRGKSEFEIKENLSVNWIFELGNLEFEYCRIKCKERLVGMIILVNKDRLQEHSWVFLWDFRVIFCSTLLLSGFLCFFYLFPFCFCLIFYVSALECDHYFPFFYEDAVYHGFFSFSSLYSSRMYPTQIFFFWFINFKYYRLPVNFFLVQLF